MAKKNTQYSSSKNSSSISSVSEEELVATDELSEVEDAEEAVTPVVIAPKVSSPAVVNSPKQVIEVGELFVKGNKIGKIIWIGRHEDTRNVKVRWEDNTIEFFLEKNL